VFVPRRGLETSRDSISDVARGPEKPLCLEICDVKPRSAIPRVDPEAGGVPDLHPYPPLIAAKRQRDLNNN